MSSEKKSVLTALCVSAVIAIALFVAIILVAQTGKAYLAAVIFFFFAVFFIYALTKADELVAMWDSKKKLAKYDATHPRAVPPTRAAAVVWRRHVGHI
ncbi:MAG TPA: hypothetical protein DEB73_00110 [Candidatus Magasanikbacteria bacterium]|uniref:Uncharacterized protein n=2 Tax=Candidatus Magasanikiibacteriota TaxID=1752731 RepID=A0A0G0ZIS5_9BACT|nr:MAG: hypothetical protein UU49_C0013G0008 [Candidatus Magasanikbacteria bacterium GW2011_GWC2_41_17]KKS12913.1 MAG: hypothetical protein UU69_C0019G0005 [Candidatus Magasanikbacteria bacterium GW2011_GWA2_41_55]HBV57672.1 hypothetical protein [Candidatus Magasanikbacteria bacterium]HBX15687.1 hypothetical protein [Candidatus Magasanikbacteria bacterium]